jgi:hypothetical protein
MLPGTVYAGPPPPPPPPAGVYRIVPAVGTLSVPLGNCRIVGVSEGVPSTSCTVSDPPPPPPAAVYLAMPVDGLESVPFGSSSMVASTDGVPSTSRTVNGTFGASPDAPVCLCPVVLLNFPNTSVNVSDTAPSNAPMMSVIRLASTSVFSLTVVGVSVTVVVSSRSAGSTPNSVCMAMTSFFTAFSRVRCGGVALPNVSPGSTSACEKIPPGYVATCVSYPVPWNAVIPSIGGNPAPVPTLRFMRRTSVDISALYSIK